MKKINIAELLKDCPHGMELDCALCEDVTLIHVLDGIAYPVKIDTPVGIMSLNKYGCCSNDKHSKCIIFPKGKTTWEGFVPPCQFKEGDIVAACTDSTQDLQVFILQEAKSNTKGRCYIGYDFILNESFDAGVWKFDRLATEEEKQKLFDAIKEHGYKWNEETKTLEKLIKPKFKVGDNIRIKGQHAMYVVTELREDRYMLDDKDLPLLLKNQDHWELVPDKFDINTLKPFDRVLVRLTNNCVWMPKFFSRYDSEMKCYSFIITDNLGYTQCIPYEGNEHLAGKTDDCDEYYKTWEERA